MIKITPESFLHYAAYSNFTKEFGLPPPSEIVKQARELDDEGVINLITHYMDLLSDINLADGFKASIVTRMIMNPPDHWGSEFWRFALWDSFPALALCKGDHAKMLDWVESKWRDNDCATLDELNFRRELQQSEDYLIVYRGGFLDGVFWTPDRDTAEHFYRYRLNQYHLKAEPATIFWKTKLTGIFNLWRARIPVSAIAGVRVFENNEFNGWPAIREILIYPEYIAPLAEPCYESWFQPRASSRRPMDPPELRMVLALAGILAMISWWAVKTVAWALSG